MSLAYPLVHSVILVCSPFDPVILASLTLDAVILASLTLDTVILARSPLDTVITFRLARPLTVILASSTLAPPK